MQADIVLAGIVKGMSDGKPSLDFSDAWFKRVTIDGLRRDSVVVPFPLHGGTVELFVVVGTASDLAHKQN
jgi:hypothetical protein